ncbi:MAG: trigger factor [Candidatus Binatia bacterium]
MTKVEMESVDAVRRRLAVEVPASEVTSEIERAYDALRRKARVPGFRPGKAPRAVLEQLFGDQVRADVFGRLVQESFAEAVREQQIQPVSSPEIVTESAEIGSPLRYSATVEVRPTVSATGYAGLAVERPQTAVTDEEVERFIDGLREREAILVPVTERVEAQRGDIAVIDYEAHIATKRVGKGEQRLVEIGGEPPDGPGARLEGARVGEPTSFEIAYPADHPNAELAGNAVEFRATVTALSRRDVPPLDDAFARSQADCETVDELRARVREQLEAGARRDADARVRAALLGQLVAAHDFAVPQAMIERRAEVLVDEVLENLGPRRPPTSQEAELRAKLHHDLQDQARDQVKAALILESVAQQEGLSIDEEALEAHIDRIAESAGKARERVRALYQDAATRAGLRGRLLQERALDLVVARAVIADAEPRSHIAGVL